MRGNEVITPAQAKQITGGRTPLVPVQYEQAVAALNACLTIDDAKVFSDKADALAAWAKIYRDNQVSRQAKMLKLHAYRRMGELAIAIRGDKRKHYGGRKGSAPSANKLLIDSGIKQHHARSALNFARANPEEFAKTVQRAKGIEASAREYVGRGAPARPAASDAWNWLTDSAHLYRINGALSKRYPAEVASELRDDEIARARKLVVAIVEWLDAFEQHLPKSKHG